MTRRTVWWWFLLPCIPILAAWDRFIVPAGTRISDVLISHYPNLLFIQRSLASGQGMPLWSPLILSGYPLAANPLSTLGYPPAWIGLLFPLPLGINLVLALHVFIGGYGFYRLIREMQIDERVAVLGGLLYGCLPAGFSHVAAGHFTWVCASAWLPWLLTCGWNGSKSDWKTALRAGLFLGLMAMADLRFTAYSGFFWLGLMIFRSFTTGFPGSRTEKLKSGGRALASLILAAGLSAVVWMPLMEYTGLSTRSLMTASDAFFLSLPLMQITGLIVPGLPASIEWIIYPGAGCLLLAAISLSSAIRRKDLFFWLGMGVIFFLWSLGDGFPPNRWLVTLPGFDLLRVPARGGFFLGVALLAAAMISLDYLIRENPRKAIFQRLATLFLAILVVFIQIFIIVANPQKNMMLAVSATAWLAIAGSILCFSYRKISANVLFISFSLFALVDLAYTDLRLTGWISMSDALAEGKEEAQFILDSTLGGRVFSPSYSLPQHTAAQSGLELADGIDPLQLKSYSDFVLQAGKLESNGYSVTLPPFKTGDPVVDNLDMEADAEAFGLLNVRYLVSAFPLANRDWELVKQTGLNYIYQNPKARGWAWVETDPAAGLQSDAGVTRIDREANRISLEAAGPGKLVLSEINYPGWQARVDGQPAVIETAHQILRAVELGEGQHSIEFQFVPYRTFAGAGISILTILLMIILSRVKTIHA